MNIFDNIFLTKIFLTKNISLTQKNLFDPEYLFEPKKF